MRKQLRQWFILLAIALSLFGPQARADDQPLPADQAFRLTVTAPGADTLRAQWVIAKNYYLYKSKFRFTSASPGMRLGEAAFPSAQIKQDPNFGRLEVYHNRVTIDIPLRRGAGAGTTMTLNVTYQGCAEVLGVCYPPQHRSVKVTLPAAAPTPATTTTGNRPQRLNKALAQFNQNFGGDNSGDSEILPVDQAFRFDAAINGDVISANWQIAPGTYLYRDKVQFGLADAQGVRIGAYTLPPGEDKYEQVLQKHERIFRNRLAVQLPLTVTNPATKQVTLLVSYQGCSAASGVCYPPVQKRVVLTLGAATTTAVPATAAAATAAVGPLTLARALGRRPARAARRRCGGGVPAVPGGEARQRGVVSVFRPAGSDDVARIYGGVGFRRIATACIAEPPVVVTSSTITTREPGGRFLRPSSHWPVPGPLGSLRMMKAAIDSPASWAAIEVAGAVGWAPRGRPPPPSVGAADSSSSR